jgi:uncharacterized protein YbcI
MHENGTHENATQESATQENDRQPPPGETLQEIANAMMSQVKTQFGRGPTRARAEWCGPDTVSVFLEGILTPAEQNLIEMGEHQRLRDLRLFFQYSSVRELCEPVEAITGRKVKAFISGMDTVCDGLSVEMFILHPRDYDGPSRIDIGEAVDPPS